MSAMAATAAHARGCIGKVCGSIDNKTSEYVFACTTRPNDIKRWTKASDCPAGKGYKVKPHTASSDGRRVDLDAFYVPGDHVFDGKVRCTFHDDSNGPYAHGWYKMHTDCVTTITAIRSTKTTPPPPPPPAVAPPPPPITPYRQYQRVVFKTWKTAAGYRTADCAYSDRTCRIGSLWANTSPGNYFYCQVSSSRELTDSGYRNHWWLYTDLDAPAGSSGWVSAVYVTVGAQDAPIPGLRTC